MAYTDHERRHFSIAVGDDNVHRQMYACLPPTIGEFVRSSIVWCNSSNCTRKFAIMQWARVRVSGGRCAPPRLPYCCPYLQLVNQQRPQLHPPLPYCNTCARSRSHEIGAFVRSVHALHCHSFLSDANQSQYSASTHFVAASQYFTAFGARRLRLGDKLLPSAHVDSAGARSLPLLIQRSSHQSRCRQRRLSGRDEGVTLFALSRRVRALR